LLLVWLHQNSAVFVLISFFVVHPFLWLTTLTSDPIYAVVTKRAVAGSQSGSIIDTSEPLHSILPDSIDDSIIFSANCFRF